MYHPSRRHNVYRIISACAPIPLRLALDPEPHGRPSPLRTARIAWSSAREEATHHLVLQDDVVLAAGFARHLTELVARWPDHALALYVNWNSPYNSYRVRCAAVAGRSWAPMAPWEWIPTLGLVLPARHARDLAAYLRTLPITCTKDDYAVNWFCTDRNIPVLAAVPHLLEHGEGPSLAGNAHQGSRHATVTAGLRLLAAGHWAGRDVAYDHAHLREAAVSVTGSRCYVRHWALDGEPSLDRSLPDRCHWARRCDLFGVPSDRIVAAFRERYGNDVMGVDPGITLEFWAAGFLLGAEVGAVADPWHPPDVASPLARDCLRTWVRSGLDSEHAAVLGPDGRRCLLDVCAAAVAEGIVTGAAGPAPSAGRSKGAT
jgi:hypothetical protein